MRLHRFIRAGAILLVAVGMLASAAWSAKKPDSRRANPRTKVDLKPGQPAPDVVLSPLTFKTNDKGEEVGTIVLSWNRLSP